MAGFDYGGVTTSRRASGVGQLRLSGTAWSLILGMLHLSASSSFSISLGFFFFFNLGLGLLMKERGVTMQYGEGL